MKQQCTASIDGKRCETQGEPEPGYDFFVCGECLDVVANLLEAKANEKAREFRSQVGGGVG